MWLPKSSTHSSYGTSALTRPSTTLSSVVAFALAITSVISAESVLLSARTSAVRPVTTRRTASPASLPSVMPFE